MLSNAVVCSRLVELQTAISAELIQLEISNRNARIQALQEIWDRGRRLIDARARDLADIPGGNTGLLVRDYKGRNADVAVYKADTALMAELRAVMRQAAEELGQWVTKSEPSHLNVNEITERLNAGRERARKAALEEAALQEAKGRQALASGTQTAA